MTTYNYPTFVRRESKVTGGVTYVVERMSFARRIDLMKTVRQAARALEFQRAGKEEDSMLSAILSAEIDRSYVAWGLREVEGLLLDGEKATPETLATRGPEALFLEALEAVKQECGLTDAEKKT